MDSSSLVGDFWALLLRVLGYQLVGVAIFLPLELRLSKGRIAFPDRIRGLQFLLAGALAIALVGTALEAVKQTLGIKPLVTLHFGFWSPVIASIALGLWLDLQFYTIHRLQHRFFWRFHAVHHSIRNLSAANSYHHWTEPLMGLTVFIPLMFVDVEIAPTLVLLTFFFKVWHFYLHTSSEPHLGPLRWLLVDNRYHRIHHSLDPAHHHKNFGAMTPLWDWLFGTLFMADSKAWPEVGLPHVGEPKNLAEWESLPRRLRRSELNAS